MLWKYCVTFLSLNVLYTEDIMTFVCCVNDVGSLAPADTDAILNLIPLKIGFGPLS